MIKCLSLSCYFRLFICSFKAITSVKSQFEQFCFLSSVKPLVASVLHHASFVTIMSKSSNMFIVVMPILFLMQSYWSRYVHVKRNLLGLRLMYTSVPFKQILHLLKWTWCFYFLKVFLEQLNCKFFLVLH